jgi:fused signal recognition particle receptor
MNLINKLKGGLRKTREQIFNQIENAIITAREIDDFLLEDIEDLLIAGDVGVETAGEIMERVKQEVQNKGFKTSDQLRSILKTQILNMFVEGNEKGENTISQPYVILVVGVNGTGKTTSIAKIAARYQNLGKDVVLVAADTFRAAAIEQLQIWADRIETDVIKHQSGADPGAVVFDAMHSAKSRQRDVVIIDTAGRLHTKINLMEELKKIRRVIQKVIPEAPQETLLVLDATIGQNAISQAKQFIETVNVNGIVLTKLDGTAKGGAVIGISHQLRLPVKYIGVGEKIDDLQPFDAGAFVESLF